MTLPETPQRGLGAHTDPQSDDPNAGSVIALLKGIRYLLAHPPSSGGGLTDAELRASPVKVVGPGGFGTTDPVTVVGPSGILDVAIFGSVRVFTTPFITGVEVQGVGGGPVPVSGPLTDAQLRASAVKAREDLTAMTWVSSSNVAPAANAVQADTGALAAGDYDFDISLGVSDTVAVGKGILIEHRNAANGATLFTLGFATPNGGSIQLRFRHYTIAANERIRTIIGTVAGAANSRYQSAIGRRIS